MRLPDTFSALCEKFERFPGIGAKTARRMVFFILEQEREWVDAFARSLVDLRDNIGTCPICGCLSSSGNCPVCSDPSRDSTAICVVENQEDCIAIEQSGVYRGLYHVLGGRCSPLDEQTIPEASLQGLKKRIADGGVEEVILALSPRVEGDMTAYEVSDALRGSGVKITRLSYGLPIGGSISYSDTMTLHVALESRSEL